MIMHCQVATQNPSFVPLGHTDGLSIMVREVTAEGMINLVKLRIIYYSGIIWEAYQENSQVMGKLFS